jgi:starch synthase
VPVLASRVGGLPEVVAEGETGLLVPPGDFEALAAAALRLLADPAERARLSRNARERALLVFQVAPAIARWEALFARLLG